MILKRLKKLSWLTVLIAVRQLWFLATNLYQLYYEPYLTIKKLKDSRDKSQIFLISLTAISPFLVYIVLRIVHDLLKYGKVILIAGRVFEVAAIIQIIALTYLGYWTLKVISKNK